MDGHGESASESAGSPEDALSYFTYGQHQGWLYLHILTMTIAWIGIMPIGP